MKTVRNTKKIDIIRKDANEKSIKQQSKLTYYLSMEFINVIQILIVIHLNKMSAYG